MRLRSHVSRIIEIQFIIRANRNTTCTARTLGLHRAILCGFRLLESEKAKKFISRRSKERRSRANQGSRIISSLYEFSVNDRHKFHCSRNQSGCILAQPVCKDSLSFFRSRASYFLHFAWPMEDEEKGQGIKWNVHRFLDTSREQRGESMISNNGHYVKFSHASCSIFIVTMARQNLWEIMHSTGLSNPREAITTHPSILRQNKY